MKPSDLIPLLPVIDNGWTFAAFVIVVLLWLYASRREPTKRHRKRPGPAKL